MTDFADLLIADRGQKARPIHLVDKGSFDDWLKGRSPADRALLKAQWFDGKTAFASVLLPAGDGEFEVLGTVADVAKLSPWCLANLGETLPEGHYKLAEGAPGPAAFGWLVAQHRFDRYKSKPNDEQGPRVLLSSEASRIDQWVHLAEATALVRDLVNTPASDMGPADLEQAARALAKGESGAKVEVTAGDALAQGYPMIAAVGGGASRDRAPRLIELHWGNPRHSRIAIVGKGVCFDSGGLDVKSAGGMRLMKKDMGGAAHAIALARLIIAERLPVRLHLLVPAVENSISANAYRPGDILKSRKGLTVEIENTDAEGRLVLGDALARADENEPELMIDFATLTGAARVALGPDLPALFANNDSLADELQACGTEEGDPLWRMPLWEGYDEMLKSDIADLSNASEAPLAGAVTAALFLQRFVPEGRAWAHLDTFAWRPAAKPGRPKGGDALGLRAVFGLLQKRYPRE
jgi:leucyl aminopeptidase